MHPLQSGAEAPPVAGKAHGQELLSEERAAQGGAWDFSTMLTKPFFASLLGPFGCAARSSLWFIVFYLLFCGALRR